MRTIEQKTDFAAVARRSISTHVSGKIQGHHLEKLAVVHVRQSTPRQVLEHHESTDLQYKLADRAVALGWPRDRVLVIDDDLGQSGTTAENRVGFQRLLAEIGLSHVGLVLGIEMSRLARSGKDWHQLLELCAVFGSLLADLDGLYDPGHYNDRLLLGLKGTMSEAELHLLRTRLMEGKRNKAERGELFGHQPTGYVRLPSGEVILDPDEQVQSELEMASPTLQGWCREGWVHARKVTVAYRRFVIWADGHELDRLRRLRDYQRPSPRVPYPRELTTPRPRAER